MKIKHWIICAMVLQVALIISGIWKFVIGEHIFEILIVLINTFFFFFNLNTIKKYHQ